MPERPTADLVVTGSSELVTCAGPAPAAGADQARLAILEDGAVAARAGRIVWVGEESRLEREVDVSAGAVRIDVRGRAVLPGLVDAHTHLVWAGQRVEEFQRRLAGASYSEIAAAGGGILSTVEATRVASREELAALAGERMDRLAARGTTAVEVKSGYGLSPKHEIKLLEAVRDAARRRPQRVVPTFLGAHTLPREARGSNEARERYVASVCEEMIPQVAENRLAEFADVFVDENAFTVAEARRVLETAREHGLGVKLHAEQLARDGAAALAAELGAASADHLEYAADEDLDALARARTVAVLLPGATLFLRMDRWAPARRMIEHGVPVAVATDLNPGSCPCESLPLVLQLACLRCGLSIDEAIVAATLNAAAACGIADECGSIEPGKRCDLLVLDAAERAELIYRLGSERVYLAIANGRVVT
jgi:imidazolonepropionase